MSKTPFSDCELPIDLFNTNRLVKNHIKNVLGRVGYLMLRDGTLEIKGTKVPQLNTSEVQQIVGDMEA